MNLDPLPALPSGRRAYEQARKLQRAKRRFLLSRVTVRREMEAEVLKFPTEEVADGREGHEDLHPRP